MTDLDVAVVGAGIIGCLVARELIARSPGRSVAVLDRDAAGSGASGRSIGLHFPRGATPRVRNMAEESQRFYESLLGNDPTLPVYPLSMLVLSSDTEEHEVRTAYLDGAHLTRTEPADGPLHRPTRWAWRGDGCHYADVPALVTALSRDLRPRVRFLEGVAVRSVEPTDADVLLGLGTGLSLRVDAVVLAPGPWLDAPAWRAVLAPLGARVKKIVALHLDRVPEPGDRAVVFQDDDSFLLPLPHRGHWIFSHTCQDWDVDPDTLREGLSAADLAAALDCLGRHAPELVDRVAGGRVFCDAYSPDREPIIRAVDESGRIVFAGAANGSGYRLAPAIAARAVALLEMPPSRRTHA
jgi:D-arginine dehydrogenase